MDTRLIEYIIKIYEEENITRAAEKLCITQSALNQQLIKLEKELDVQLFHRNRISLKPTNAGEIYINNAKEMLLLKQDTYRRISDEAKKEKGELSIGFTPGRGSVMFSNVYPIFHKKYPDVFVTPNEMTVKMLQQEILSGGIDIGFMTLNKSQRNNDNYIDICSENIYLVLSPNHKASKTYKIVNGKYPKINLKDIEGEPFVTIHKKSTLSEITYEIFEKENIEPLILFETSSNTTIASMVRANLCCGLLPEYYVKTIAKDLLCFELPENPSWDIVASYRKKSYLSLAGKYFIKLVNDYWKEDAEKR